MPLKAMCYIQIPGFRSSKRVTVGVKRHWKTTQKHNNTPSEEASLSVHTHHARPREEALVGDKPTSQSLAVQSSPPKFQPFL